MEILKNESLYGFRIEVIKQRMIDSGIPQDEVNELIKPLESELNRRVCGLVWNHEGATTKLIEDMEGKLPVLIPIKDKNIVTDTNGLNHVLIEGENLLTLMAMQYTHIDENREGMVDAIYIDPPYNTGNVTFDYNDKFEKSEWLSMMNVRLRLAKNLLAPHGTIFMSIDEHYQAELKMLCDEIFQTNNYLGTIHWRRRHNQPNDKKKLIAVVAEFIFAYAKDINTLKEYGVGKIPLTGNYTNPDNDPRGPWTTTPWKSSGSQSGCTYEIITPTGKHYTEEWLGTKETFEKHLQNGCIHFPNKGDGIPRKKIYQTERMNEGQCASNWWEWKDFGSNQEATDLLKSIFNTDATPFNNPKPVKLIKRILGLATVNKSATILDFFGGSGTTLQAVMELNQDDGGRRQCIICTNNELGDDAVKLAKKDGVTTDMSEWEDYGVCKAVTYPRIKTVITGERMDGSKYSDGMSGNNLYYYQISNNIQESAITKITKDALAKQAVSYIALKENIFNVNEHKDYHILSNTNSEVLVVIDPDKDYRDVHDNIATTAFSKDNRKVYCSLKRKTTVDGIEYIPYPEEVLDVLKAAKKRVKKESKR